MKVYGLHKCTTSQAALAFLAEKNVAVAFTCHQQTPPTKAQVAAWSKAVGGWEKLINRSGYTWRGLPTSATENLTEAKAVALAVKHTSLIRRPLIEHPDGTVTVGFTAGVKARF
jgi:arsenate reductase (glutaredoxin)